MLAIFGTLTQNVEPMVDEYCRSFQMPFVTVSEAFRDKQHEYKLRLLPDIAPTLSDLLDNYLKWPSGFYFYNSKPGET